MKRIKHILLAIWLLTALVGISQSKNPYKSIGKKSQTLTLTKGKYEEFFDQDSIQQIGTVLMNVRTMKVVKLLDEKDAKQRLENEKGSRFLSVDPLAVSFPWNSPYAYAEGDVIRSIDLDGAEKNVRTFSYSVSNGETQFKVVDNVWHGTYIGYKPTTEEEKIAIGFVGSNNLPDDGTFTFFEFAPELGKANYARYEYTDPGGAQQLRYFDANYIDFMYEQLDIARTKLNKVLKVVGSTTNALGAGAAVKAELKAASEEAQVSTKPASTFLGGAKKDLYSKQKILEANHAPTMKSFEIAGFKISYNEGSAFQMLYDEHRLFISTGRDKAAVVFRNQEANLLKQGKFMEAFDLNVQRVKSTYGNKYDGAMGQAREYYQNKIVPQLQQQLKQQTGN
jgi:hypothetical protein